MLIKGRVKAIAYKSGVTVGCFSKLFAMKGAVTNTNKIKNRLNKRIKKNVEKTIFLLRILFSLTNLDMLIGRAN